VWKPDGRIRHGENKEPARGSDCEKALVHAHGGQITCGRAPNVPEGNQQKPKKKGAGRQRGPMRDIKTSGNIDIKKAKKPRDTGRGDPKKGAAVDA